MARVQLLLCITILFATVSLLDLASAHLKYKPSLPQLEDPKTVKDVEPYTVKVVMVFVADLEKECPKNNKFKTFFEKLRGFAKYVCPIKRRDQVDYDRDLKAKAGGIFKAISSFAIGKIREEIQEEKMEAINTFKFMKSVAAKIMGGRREEESEDTMKLTAEQQKEIKEGILKWETIITRITNTMVMSSSNSSSSEESNVENEDSSSNSKSSGKESSTSAKGSSEETKDSKSNSGSPSGTGSPSSSPSDASGKETTSKDTKTKGESSSAASGKETSSKDTKTKGESSSDASGKETNSKDTKTKGESSSDATGKETNSKDTKTKGEISSDASGKETSTKDAKATGEISASEKTETSQSSTVNVEQVEAETSKQVSSFIMNLEKKCPQKEEYKAFFEQLKGTMIAPVKEGKDLFTRIKSAAGKVSGAMAFIRSRVESKSAEVKQSMETYQGEVMKTLQELETIHSQIVSQNKGKTEGSLTCTPAQQMQIKQTITKWEQVTTQFVETASQSETKTSSSASSSASGKMVAN